MTETAEPLAGHDPFGLLEARMKDLDSCAYSYKLQVPSGSFGMDMVLNQVPEVNESEMSVVIPFADGNRRDGVGDILEVAGIRLERHRSNPIVLFDHGKQVALPVALAEDPKTKEYTVAVDPIAKIARAKCFFYRGTGMNGVDRSSEHNHAVFCEQLFDLIAKGYVRGGSIGYQVVKAMQLQPDYQAGTPPGLHLIETNMLEVSAVVLPANGDTVRKMLCLPSVCGKPMSPWLVKSLTAIVPEETKTVSGYERKAQPEKSRGHIAFQGDFEYFVDGGGELYRAKINEVVMPDGYRTGRWEAPAHLVKTRLQILGIKSYSSNHLEGRTDHANRLSRSGVPAPKWRPGQGAIKALRAKYKGFNRSATLANITYAMATGKANAQTEDAVFRLLDVTDFSQYGTRIRSSSEQELRAILQEINKWQPGLLPAGWEQSGGIKSQIPGDLDWQREEAAEAEHKGSPQCVVCGKPVNLKRHNSYWTDDDGHKRYACQEHTENPAEFDAWIDAHAKFLPGTKRLEMRVFLDRTQARQFADDLVRRSCEVRRFVRQGDGQWAVYWDTACGVGPEGVEYENVAGAGGSESGARVRRGPTFKSLVDSVQRLFDGFSLPAEVNEMHGTGEAVVHLSDLKRKQEAMRLLESAGYGKVREATGGSLVVGIKSLNLRQKYRKGFKVRTRRSATGHALVNVSGKDLSKVQEECLHKGVECERIGVKGDFERVRLSGDDKAIDGIAQRWGRRVKGMKTYPVGGKFSVRGSGEYSAQEIHDMMKQRIVRSQDVVPVKPKPKPDKKQLKSLRLKYSKKTMEATNA